MSRELLEFVVDTVVKPVVAVAVAKVAESWWRKRYDAPSAPSQTPPLEDDPIADKDPHTGR